MIFVWYEKVFQKLMKIFTRRSYEKKRASSDVMPTMTRNDEEGRKEVAEESRVKHCLTQHLLYINQ